MRSNEPEVELPAASAAEQVTVVVPSGNISPDAWSQLTGTAPSTASLAEVVKLTLAPLAPAASAVRLPGKPMAGAVVSVTEMLKEPLADRPPASVTEQATVVVQDGEVVKIVEDGLPFDGDFKVPFDGEAQFPHPFRGDPAPESQDAAPEA